jgi:hypothetical protein
MEKAKVSEDFLRDIVLDWRALRSKRQKRRKFKDYQEQLLKEIPGAANRTNVAMHAVIDVTTSAGENQTKGMEASTEIRNQALIHYIARLASSNNDDDEFDFSFVESLLENGADINTADKYGQTMFHEVARSWNVDVARFLLNRGTVYISLTPKMINAQSEPYFDANKSE